MSDLYVNSWELVSYKAYLVKQSDILKNRLIELGKIFLSLEWNDNVMQATQQALNAHISTINKLLQLLDGLINNLDEFISCVNKYLQTV